MAEGDRIFQRIRVKIVGTGASIETRKTQIHCVGTAEHSGTQHFFVAHRGKDTDADILLLYPVNDLFRFVRFAV